MIEVQQWIEIAESTTANMMGERVQSTSNPHKMADAICTYIDLQGEIRKDVAALVEKRKDVISVIEQLDTLEYDILHKIYVQHITLQDVAEEYDRTYSWVTTVHGRALKSVQTILDKRGDT
jgi:DNA-directed RNA polymerase specialized sigma subunit